MFAAYQLVVFQVMASKSDFLLIGTWTITPKESMNTANFGKTSLFVEYDLNNKQELIYGVLESTNHLEVFLWDTSIL